MSSLGDSSRENICTFSNALRLCDILSVIFGGWIAYIIKFGATPMPAHYVSAIFIAALLVLLIFPISNTYHSWRNNLWSHQIRIVLSSWLIVASIMIAVAFFSKTSADYSRDWLFIWSSASLIFFFGSRYILRYILNLIRKKGLDKKNLLIIGAGDLGQSIVSQLQTKKYSEFNIVGYLDDDPTLHKQRINGLVCLGDINQIEATVNKLNVNEVVIALPFRSAKRTQEVTHMLRHNTATIRYIPDIYGLNLMNSSATKFAGFHALNLSETPMNGINIIIKTLEDKILSALILLLISPLFIVISIAVKLSSPGPIFFRQQRVSWNNKTFDILKFRSMPVNVEKQNGAQWATKGENRATRVGSFLRRTSLDELPQFINVLKGEMSIVGPRPERPVFVDKFKDEIPQYMQKHLVKAGITGWAQINGWRGDTDLKKRIQYDLYYIENWSILFDLKIIFLTIFKGFVHKNAY
ncbi:MAG: undecaprenyl-phosphate glucose phosphotransferase [Gammaproteobacteria bacterium]|nr:undecaprenyl-phosphate glucose phosphotransferase [Gammaproteobacteria bacterium]